MSRILWTLLIIISFNCHSQILNQTQIPEIIKYYGISSKSNLLADGFLFNKSMTTSVRINLKYLGFGSVIAPPNFCYPNSVILKMFGKKVRVVDYEWYLSEMHCNGELINGINYRLTVFPVSVDRAVVAELQIVNNTDTEQLIPIDWIIEGQVGATNNWEWYPPNALFSKKENTIITPNNDRLILQNDTVTVSIKGYGTKVNANEGGLSAAISLKPGEKKIFGIILKIENKNDKKKYNADIDNIIDSPKLLAKERASWEDLLDRTESQAPKLIGGIEELTSFYRKGLITYLTCRWEIPYFVINPWYAESGIDGGAMNSYYWGLAYISRLMSIMEPSVVRKLLISYIKADLVSSYALNPSNGKGMGVLYSYNYYSIARATYDYVLVTGDTSILNERIGEQSYLEYMYNFCLLKENLEKDPELINYGENHNLLELKLTNDYTNFTPSPNAERLLIYKYLTCMYKWVNKSPNHNLLLRGEKLRKVFQEKLWDSKNNWLFCLDNNNRKLTAYSIQIFDVLRTGILTSRQEGAIIKHLNETEFLTPWGVYSLAKTDKGFDVKDVDWGGPGVYAGDAPELIEDLIHSGYKKEGVDILRRILWWGEFPYYPQAIRADKKGYREDGRPNVIAGLATTQSVIFGLFGINIEESRIKISPVNDPILFGVSLAGLKIRGLNISICINRNGKEFDIICNNEIIHKSIGDIVSINLN